MNEITEVKRQIGLNQWSAMVREREDNGLSIRAFCTEKGFRTKTYYYRLRKLREAALEASMQEIMQVDVPNDVEQKSAEIIIHAGSTTIEISGNADPETVRAVLLFLRQP